MIDSCSSTFAKLATAILPGYMSRLRTAMQKPLSLTEFCISGVGVKTILWQQLQRTSDFSGCYVLLRDGKPFYVGISRGVVGRLRQHGTGKTHYDASLAYRMAFKKAPHKTTRQDAMKNATFLRAFRKAQRLLHGSDVAFIEIPNPLELYLFGAYCSMKLDTSEWNTFRTH